VGWSDILHVGKGVTPESVFRYNIDFSSKISSAEVTDMASKYPTRDRGIFIRRITEVALL
jgi:hypothetical protein